ncbi:hypothetical protein RJZ56_005072 [Blastomyces dermatitidis]|uniref:Eukaryotic mitochondrial regulator protein-domain-containing protein n=3 Tax=Blastomyces TaxID=229219 RepID=A0A179U8R2_BLAGS|nr:uncharacterized protein BDBG_00943 [Blastomyces gilchristii SLH14081]XP_045275876.1 uncharacterized protein BDCG_03951 [Blastomyces dermatitidis ER-3]EGE81761.1 hypothetical protein BDDG_04704 [Blastomyces dermatitidis ATCC 18188]EQL29992.1 hypothetical protein BDFG_07476 [Blastomyces dermatitidis ATCC 26199]EEQ88831.1 hypothetical protein BDCG_03951 [Blastomyces dermatitidis ER-3]OAT04374.1 hypothetical protein BDBG_00943 [Blastomyces gilchristii SLH14081]
MPPRLGGLRRLSCSLTSNPSPSQSSAPLCLSFTLLLSSSSTTAPSQRRLQHDAAAAPTPAEPQNDKDEEKRRKVHMWLKGPGAVFKNPKPGSTNYISAYNNNGMLIRSKEGGKDTDAETLEDLRPFPLNPTFVSESVLSEDLRNEIHRQVVEYGKSPREVSVMHGVDLKRVAAVVRLVELEKKWVAENKPRAIPYARAVHQMIPTTPLKKYPERPVPHESINDLPVHRLTEAQIFHPVSESRQFTRVDAGRVFSAAPALPHASANTPHNTPEAIEKVTHNPHMIEKLGKPNNEEEVLQPADYRIPHPHLVAFAHDRFQRPGEYREHKKRFAERIEREAAAMRKRQEVAKAKEEAKMTRIQPEGSRFEFRFRDVVVSRETTGMDGRGTSAPGRRYGVPSYERKRGAIKIPTKVEV